MKQRVALGLYGAFMRLAQPLLRRKLARRGRTEPGYLSHIDERFGRYAQPPAPGPGSQGARPLLWVHAVSLGETRTAAILIRALRLALPGQRILLTHGTATGREEGAAILEAGDVQVWQPWDSPGASARFFAHFRPCLGVLMETEVWPATVAAATAHGVPLMLVNGRMSARSLAQALRIAPLALPAYGALAAVYAQADADAERFRRLGAPVAGVFGNLKYDAAPSEALQAQGAQWRHGLGRPVLMFASSREGEESDLLAALQTSDRASRPHVLIVPRHPQRFDDVAALCGAAGLSVSRRSAWAGGPAASTEAMQADVWLGDSLGEMALYYALSGVALLGGSFAPLGGQNLIEAAACGCPVVMGPHTFNFSEAAELAHAAGAAVRVEGMAAAVDAALRLLGDPQAQAAAARAGLDFAARNRGATSRTVDALMRALHVAGAKPGGGPSGDAPGVLPGG